MRTGREEGRVGMVGEEKEKEEEDGKEEEANSGGGRRVCCTGEVSGGGDVGAEAVEDGDAAMLLLLLPSGGEWKADEADGAVLRRAAETVAVLMTDTPLLLMRGDEGEAGEVDSCFASSSTD